VRVVDFGLVEEKTPYIVMECLEGSDLHRLVRDQGALDVTTACGFVLQACEGLAAAHSVGIVHRDIKPSNLFVVKRPDGARVVKIIDFGIAKVPQQQADPNETFTRSDVVMGSPRYMSPEQTHGSRADARTDVWSLAIVLQEALTAKPVFKADSLPALFVKIVNSPPTALRTVLPDAPVALEEAIAHALEKDATKRSTLVELARAIAPFAGEGAAERLRRIETLSKIAPPSDSEPSMPETLEPSDAVTAPVVSRPSAAPTANEAIGVDVDVTLAPVEPASRRPMQRWVVFAAAGLALAVGTSAVVAMRFAQQHDTPTPAAPSVSVATIASTPSSTVVPTASVVIAKTAPIATSPSATATKTVEAIRTIRAPTTTSAPATRPTPSAASSFDWRMDPTR
jgi:serine/threonine-protein kinase